MQGWPAVPSRTAGLQPSAARSDRTPVIPFRRLLVLSLLLLPLAAPAAAQGEAFAPPNGKVLNGLTAGYDFDDFTRRAGKAPAVWQHFVAWNGSLDYTVDNTRKTGARLMYHLGTASGQNLPERISPGEIARGRGDAYLIRLTRTIAEYGRPAYIRLMAEMNQANNGYSAFDRSGRSRGPAHSTAAFKQAWRRSTLILRGGPVADVNHKLRRLGLPAVQTAAVELPRPSIAMVWVPQTRGTPDIPANMPRAYWPGGAYVDWVGTDFYSRFPNFHWLDDFYRDFAGKPFVFGEWALWGADDPAFVSRLFGWIASHPRVRMVLYNQGKLTDGPFRLKRYPRSAAALRKALSHRRFEL